MPRHRRNLSPVLVGLSLLAVTAAARADDAPLVRVSELPSRMQSAVTVVGRTGYIADQYEKKGLHVFTLRDDHNGQVFVRMPSDHYPVMGTTCRVTGYATRSPGGTVFLDTFPNQITSVYPPVAAAPVPLPMPAPAPPSMPSQVLLWAPSVVSLGLIAVVLATALRRWLGRPRPEWGELLVTGGPDRGMTVSLRQRRLALGRGVSAARDVRFSGSDQTISNVHALLTYRRGQLSVCDLSSNGTRLGGERLEAGRPRKINSGDLLHLGTRGTVVIVRLRDQAPAPGGLLGLLREPTPMAERTIMAPEPAAEDLPWMRPAPAAPAAPPPTETTPAPARLAAPAREAEADELDGEQDSVPHTYLSPMIFSFSGHTPRGSHPRVEGGAESSHDADEETASH